MLNLIFALIASLLGSAAAQATSYEPGTGLRSLWIPYKTVSGTPVASIIGRETDGSNRTSYVISCPTASPACAISPNLTLTEGPSTARYVTSNTFGAATIHCKMTAFTTGECYQERVAGGQIDRSSASVGTDEILYQAMLVTATANATTSGPDTVTVTQLPTSSSTTSSSLATFTGGVPTAPANGAWAVGGAVGAGLAALAAL